MEISGVSPVSLSMGVLQFSFREVRWLRTSVHHFWHQACQSYGALNSLIHLFTICPKSPIPCLAIFCHGEWGLVNFVSTQKLRHHPVHFMLISVCALSVFKLHGRPIFFQNPAMPWMNVTLLLRVTHTYSRFYVLWKVDYMCVPP